MRKVYKIGVASILFLVGQVSLVFGQCPNNISPDGQELFLTNKICAQENYVWWLKDFSNATIDEGTYDVYIGFDWGDGTPPEYFRATGANNQGGNVYKRWYFTSTNTVSPPSGYSNPATDFAYHEYASGLDVCSINLSVYLVITNDGASPATGTICTGSMVTKVIPYWDTEEHNTGNLDIDEPDGNNDDIVQVCANNDVIIDPFKDGTIFNCVDAALDTKNDGDRWYQWNYNTNDYGANTIQNVEILDNGNNVVSTLNGGAYSGTYEETVQYDPGPSNLTTSANDSYKLHIPATATVGQRFRITFNNWNPCNPFDDPDIAGSPSLASSANADNGPKSTTVEIVVVPPPSSLSITLTDANNNVNTIFCPLTEVKFASSASGGNLSYKWEVYQDDGSGTYPNLVHTENYNTQNFNWTTGFPSAGDYRVVLYVRDNNIIKNSCISTITKDVTVISAPTAAILMDNTSGVHEVSFCASDASKIVNLKDVSTNKNSNTETTWDITKNGTSISGFPQVTTGASAVDLGDVDFNLGTGEYDIELRTKSLSSNCETVDQAIVYVYDDPEATFSANNVCAGNKTDFTNISTTLQGISPQVNGDKITTWDWDFSYDATAGFNTELSQANNTDFSRNLDGNDGTVEPAVSLPGTYTVALRVTTLHGCSALYSSDVTVKENPTVSFATTNYTGAICPGETIDFNNTTGAQPASTMPVTYSLQVVRNSDAQVMDNSADLNLTGTLASNFQLTFPNAAATTETYTVTLTATGNNGCPVATATDIDVKSAPPSNFDVFEDAGLSIPYDPANPQCSPFTFYFEADAATQALSPDNYIWTVKDGADTIAGPTTNPGSNPDFYYTFNNDYPNTLIKTFTIVMQPTSTTLCISPQSKDVKLQPLPISDFTATDTLNYCDSVTLYFEATQKGLAYTWTPQPAANVLSEHQNVGGDIYWVTFAKNPSGGGNFTATVDLQTQNPFLCSSGVTSKNTLIDEILGVNVQLGLNVIGDNCLPVTFALNNTTSATDLAKFPSSTMWRIKMVRINASNVRVDSSYTYGPIGNERFLTPYDTTFTQAGKYAFSMEALASNNCVVPVTAEQVKDIYPKPIADFSAVPMQGCSTFNVSFTDLYQANGTTIATKEWSVVDNGTGNTVYPANATAPDGYTFVNNSASVNTYDVHFRVLSSDGCDSMMTKTITVYPKPSVAFDVVSDNPACEDIAQDGYYTFAFDIQNASIANNPPGTEYTWDWGDGTANLTTDTDTLVHHKYNNRQSYFGQDSYTVKVTAVTGNACNAQDTARILLNPRINTSFFPDKNVGCAPLTVNFTANTLPNSVSHNYAYRVKGSGAAFTSFTNVPSSTGAVAQIFPNTTGANRTYEVRYIASLTSSGVTCYDTAYQDIMVYPEFDSPPISGPSSICAYSGNVQYTVANTAGSTYMWSVPSGAYISAGSGTHQISVNFGNTDGYVKVTEIDSNGCQGSPDSLFVDAIEGPSVNMSLVGDNVTCPNPSDYLQFDITDPGYAGTYNVTYSDGTNNFTLNGISSGHQELVSPSSSTSYYLVSAEQATGLGCSAKSLTGSVLITVVPTPTAEISGDNTICEGDQSNLIFSFTGTGPWEFYYKNTTTNATFGPITSYTPVKMIAVSPGSTSTYALTSIQDLNGGNNPQCTGTVTGTATVTVNKIPTAEIYGDTEGCLGNSITLYIDLTGVAPWTIRYSDGSNTFIIPNITPPSSYNAATDTYTYTFQVNPPVGKTSYTLVEVDDSNTPQCQATTLLGSAKITIPNSPTASLSGDTTICNGDSAPITFNLSGDGPFDVTYTDGQQNYTLNNINDGEVVNVSPSTTMQYNLVSVTDNHGCHPLGTFQPVYVYVNALPTASISGADTLCYNGTGVINFEFSGVPPFTVDYKDNHGNTYTINTNYNNYQKQVNLTQNTDFTLVSIQDSNTPSCANTNLSGKASFKVYPELITGFTTPQDVYILPNSTVNFTNNTSNANTWTYQWDFGDGNTSTDQNPSHTYATYGDFNVVLTASNGQCTDTYNKVITVKAIPPVVDFDYSPEKGCAPLAVFFTNKTQYADPNTYEWDFGDGTFSGQENPIHVYKNPGIYSVKLVASNITGVKRQVIKTDIIVVNASPTAQFFIPEPQVFTGEPVAPENVSVGADVYSWDFGDGQPLDTAKNPIHHYNKTGIFDISLVVTNTTTGCTDTLVKHGQVQVKEGGTTHIPNAFTPSRKGPGTANKSNRYANDIFLPQVKGTTEYHLKIYNRWGELIFESDDKDVGWDGYYKGKLSPQDVYVYRLDVTYEDGRTETKVGDVTLIR